MCKNAAGKWINAQTEKQLPKDACANFIAVIEVELNSLHLGNIARYRLRPKDFDEWRKGWE